MPRDAVSRTANVERTSRHKWVKQKYYNICGLKYSCLYIRIYIYTVTYTPTEINFCSLSNLNEYDRTEKFSFNYEPNIIPFGS